MGWKYSGLLVAWIMFLISQGVAFYVILQLEDYKLEELDEKKFPRHQVLMFICGVVLNGQSMVIFRLLPGFRTEYLKYFHFLIHTFIAGVFIYEFVRVRGGNATKDLVGDLHKYMTYLLMFVYGLQWLLAIFIYLYMYSVQRRRKIFAAWHNFCGVCILQLAIAIVAVTIRRMDQHESLKEEMTGPLSVALCVTYGLLINAIVLNPYVEWPLMGPL